MPATKNGAHRTGDGRNIFRVSRLRIQDLRIFVPGEVLHHLVRDDSRIFLDLRCAEGRDALTKNAYNGEIQFVQSYFFPERVLFWKECVRQFLGEECDLVARRHVLGVEETALHDLEVTDLLKSFRHADHADRSLVSLDDDGHRQVSCTGYLDDFRNLVTDRSDIGEGDLVGQRCCLTRPGELRVCDVGADALDLRND